MKTLTAFTHEIDDIELAVSEILSQLALDENLCRNSVGIMSCYPEYIDSGAAAAICNALPFDVVGTTTAACGTAGEIGFLMLSVTVLTDDNVEFAAVFSDSLVTDTEGAITKAYVEGKEKLNGADADLIFAYPPMIKNVGGERIVDAIDAACGGVPIFGTIATDHTVEYIYAETICNGENSRDRLAMILMRGELNPRFFVGAASEHKDFKQKAIITKSEANTVMSVNDMLFTEYMSTLGLGNDDDSIEGIVSIPMIVDYNDGTAPITRAIYMTSEEGYAICAGKMPEGSTLSVGSLERKDVVRSAAEQIEKLRAQPDGNAAFIYPCVSHYLVLGLDSAAEFEVLTAGVGTDLPYVMAYSGGEICPQPDEHGKLINQFHNFSLVMCLL